MFDDVEIGDEGIAAASTVGGPGFAPAGARIAVTRVGRRVFLAFDEGEYATAELDGGAGAVQRVAEEFAASQ